MAIRSSSSTPWRDLDSPVDSPSPTSQDGSGKGDVARKMMMEVEHVLANSENEGVEIADDPSSRSSLCPDAMAICSAPSTPWQALDSPPVDSPSPTSQGGSGKGVVARKMMKEVEHVLANLENEGVEIDGKIASIIDGEMTKVKAEAARVNITGLKKKAMMVLVAISSAASGFFLGAGLTEQAIYAGVGKRIIYGEI
ncbi:unnamed protein product [Urochloa humidicola]